MGSEQDADGEMGRVGDGEMGNSEPEVGKNRAISGPRLSQ
jgi:hypothetical protein